jgi:hypothetical protein
MLGTAPIFERNFMNRYLLSLLSVFFCTQALYSQSKVATATRIDSKIHIDGVMNEVEWLQTPKANHFIQYSPFNGKEPTEQTFVRFLYDDNAFYIAAFMEDSEPHNISKTLGKRDEFNLADYFGVYIDPYNDASKSFAFYVTASGVQVDAKLTTYYDFRWNAVWESAVIHTPDGWSVEMRIPYSALRFSKEKNQEWGINMERVLQRKREKSTWNFIDINVDGINKQAGSLTGINNIEPPIRLAFIPYMSAYYENVDNDNSYSLKGGMDVKYGINESFTLDMMLIPDFGQVKSDKEVLNLGPFETYYGENREFFKEGMDLFSRADIFYSRRIGAEPKNFYDVADYAKEERAELLENPATTQLINATKITGKTKQGTNIGFLNAMSQHMQAELRDSLTGEKIQYTTQPFTNYNVFVIEQVLKENSYVSLIQTNLYRPSDDYVANTTGTELRYELWDEVSVNGAAALSQKYDLDDPYGYKYWMQVSRIKGNFRYSLYHNTESKTYDPNDMGYLQSPNERSQSMTLSYAKREPFWKMLNWYNNLTIRYNTMFDYNQFKDARISINSRGTTNNHLSLGFSSTVKPVMGYDYFEPRVDGYKFKTASWQNAEVWISSDYRKMFALDLKYGGWIANEYEQSGQWYSISPRIRLGDRFQMVYDFNGDDSFNSIGHVWNNGQDTVIFGRRNYRKIENNLNIDYIFTPKSSLSFYLRHYWTRVEYDEIYRLNTDGTIDPYFEYTENPDINYNAFNIDLAYTWQFAPGSEMSLVWKNQIMAETDEIINDFGQNLENTFTDLGKNSISIRILYYLDYLQIRNLFS